MYTIYHSHSSHVSDVIPYPPFNVFYGSVNDRSRVGALSFGDLQFAADDNNGNNGKNHWRPLFMDGCC